MVDNVPIVICDIDGTIADNTDRSTHLLKTPKDWSAYNKTMHEDKRHDQIIDVVNVLFGAAKIILCTGREEIYRDVTEQWLRDNLVSYDRLLMRGEKDYRGDEIVKSEMLDTLLAEGAKIWLVIDDRQKVVDMWRARGLVCLQVAPGDF